MKKIILGSLFILFVLLGVMAQGEVEGEVEGQAGWDSSTNTVTVTSGDSSTNSPISVVVVSGFSLTARDVNPEDVVVIADMLSESLATNPTLKVLDRIILEKAIADMGFQAGDWGDSVKTSQLGKMLNADYFIRGSMTQLGTSITATVICRDIKTLDVVSSEQRQYTLENIWDNSSGIPGTLTDFARIIATGINAEKKKLLARQREEQRQAEARQQQEQQQAEVRQHLVGVWRGMEEVPFPHNPGYLGDGADWRHYRLQFNADGSFNGTYDYWAPDSVNVHTGRFRSHKVYEYNGSYTLEGNILTLSYTTTQTQSFWKPAPRGSDWVLESTPTTSSENIRNNRLTISFKIDTRSTYLYLSGGNGDFSTSVTYQKK
jgi:hypothetical protein